MPCEKLTMQEYLNLPPGTTGFATMAECQNKCCDENNQSCVQTQKIIFPEDSEIEFGGGTLEKRFGLNANDLDGWKATFRPERAPTWCDGYDPNTNTYDPLCYSIGAPSTNCIAFWVVEELRYILGTQARKWKYRLLTLNCSSGQFNNVTAEYVANLDPDCGGCAPINFENGGWVFGPTGPAELAAQIPAFEDPMPTYLP